MSLFDADRSAWKRIRNTLLVLAGLAVLVGVAWLDYRIYGAFGREDLPGPSRVYSRPLELYSGKHYSLPELKQALHRRGYVAVKEVRQSGQFAIHGARVVVGLRKFRFLDGLRSRRTLVVLFHGDRVAGLRDAESGGSVPVIRLAPLPIGTFYGVIYGDRVPVHLDEVPGLLRRTLMVVEDRDFYDHFGLDPEGILRALWVNLRSGGIVQGGSTLTQQLVKSRFLSNRRTWVRKIQEAIMALLVEVHYDKETILQAYVNEVYLGQRGDRPIRGFGRASRFFFGTSLDELRPEQIALLVGMIKAPSHFNPRRHPERARRRRDVVLSLMKEHGLIDSGTMRRARSASLRLAPKENSANSPYPDFLHLVRRRLRRDFRREDLQSRGLKIYTTLSPSTQEAVERTVSEAIPHLEAARDLPEDFLQTGVVVTRIQTGEVTALLGGRTPGYPGFNRAVESSRPIGSLIKPAIYLTALSRPDSYTLVTRIQDRPFSVEQPGETQPWSPENFSGDYHDTVPLIQALAHSYNAATARLGMRIGVRHVLKTLDVLGVKSSVPPLPSVLLGSVSLSPFQVSQMYQTLANGGYRAPLKVVRGVLSPEGERLGRRSLELERVTDPGPPYLVNRALHHVTEDGTARGIRRRLAESIRFAGKTGTTQDFRDSWFVGFARSRLMTVWVGQDDFQSTELTGARGAGRIWAGVANRLPLRSRRLQPPSGVRKVWIDRESWLPSGHDCPHEIQLPFIRGSVPEQTAPCAGGFFDFLSWSEQGS